MDKFYIHMIGHGHIDPTWLWDWKEGFEEVRATFRSALERMLETPEFMFTASSACFYQWIKETEPALFEQIKQRVKEGRWEIAGGFWVEPDCNIPCGESFVRHGLYGQRFFEEEFGRKCRIGFNPDSFGHAGTLPQLLKQLGMDFYVYMRPEPDVEMNYPKGTLFWWEAQDGSSVLAAQIPLGYDTTGLNVLDKIQALPRLPFLLPEQHHILCFYGVGNHGGGPTREAIDAVKNFQTDKNQQHIEPVFSSLEKFFSALLREVDPKKIPVIPNELQYHARGCYSVHSEVKRNNRKTEHVLMTAERLATVGWLLDICGYPGMELETCWKEVLYNQFHDILAGTSLEFCYETTRDQLGCACHHADVIMNKVVQTIARDTDTSAEGNALIAWNPLCWPVYVPITVPPSVLKNLGTRVHVVDEGDTILPSQMIRGERIGHVRYRFMAELPAMNYRVFTIRAGNAGNSAPMPLSVDGYCVQNRWWTLAFDPGSGEVCRIRDNERDIEVIKRGHILAVMADHSDTWSHGLKEYRVEAGRFSEAKIQVVEQGEVQCTVRTVTRYDKSTIISEYTLYRETERIDCELRINWQQQYQTLKLGFETNIEAGIGTYEVPYGYQERSCDGGEEPGQQWFDLTGTIKGHPYGLAVLNDGKYGFDIRDGVMRMTLLRSPAYAHHDNGRFETDHYWPIIDQGWQRVKLALVPHVGSWREAKVVRRAWELNAPPVIHLESSHPGRPASGRSFVEIEADTVLITVFKKSEDGEEIVIRGYETAGRDTKTRLHLPGFNKSFDIVFRAHEIKTVCINKTTWHLRETNLLEE